MGLTKKKKCNNAIIQLFNIVVSKNHSHEKKGIIYVFRHETRLLRRCFLVFLTTFLAIKLYTFEN